MFEVRTPTVSAEFIRCWRAAKCHVERMAQGAPRLWLKADLTPPVLEHLSFRLGNQAFYVVVEDTAGSMEVPGTLDGLLEVASGCNGPACIIPMRRGADGWTPALPGWGMVEAVSRRPIEPPALVSDELIELTDWEVHEFAVQIVRDLIVSRALGGACDLIRMQGNPAVEPAIWFEGADGPEWVVVRAVRYPLLSVEPPTDWHNIESSSAPISSKGHFASVSLASAEDAFDPSGEIPPTPLWRGHAVRTIIKGLPALLGTGS